MNHDLLWLLIPLALFLKVLADERAYMHFIRTGTPRPRRRA